MKRREFIAGLGAAALPLAARAQLNDRVRRIGVLMIGDESDPVTQSFIGAFEQGLQKLGWTNGRNVRIEYRWSAAGDVERYRTFSAELVGQRPDALVAGGGPTLEAF
jgi:putative tryptophan/tyrosine transport system substrate-binding protein